MGRSQRHRVEEQGFSAIGHIYEQGAINDQILKSIGGAVTGARPVLTSINPTTAVIGGADLTLHAIGSGFDANCAILFNGGREPTVLVSPTELTTTVKPSLVTIAGSYPVQVVKGNSLVSAAVKSFTFTVAGQQTVRAPAGERIFPIGPFNLLRIEPNEDGVWYVFNRTDGGQIQPDDTLRVEATGSSDTNGDFIAEDINTDVAGETAVFREGPTINAALTAKGRATVIAGA